MPLTYQDEQWLTQAGYNYHCFISWAHTDDRAISDCARRIRDDIRNGLAGSIPNPNVFLDETVFTGGERWTEALRQALCRSLTMVAICAPIYYHPTHEWCGLEWAAMDTLSQTRLPEHPLGAIIPVIVRERGPLPTAVSAIHYHDFTRVTILGQNYFRTNDYRQKIDKIVRRIEEIAELIAINQREPECDGFQIPLVSAFSGYMPREQSSPLRR